MSHYIGRLDATPRICDQLESLRRSGRLRPSEPAPLLLFEEESGRAARRFFRKYLRNLYGIETKKSDVVVRRLER